MGLFCKRAAGEGIVKKLGRSFYSQDAVKLARGLIGKVLVHRVRGKEYRARIVETEAYVGTHDRASHASKGLTKRTEVMFGPGGHAYVYLIYGIHEMFNIVAGRRGDAQAVLIRAAEPLEGWKADLSGPGKLAHGLKITRVQNGMDLTGSILFVRGGPGYRPRIKRSKRVGVEYAKEWRDALLRFFDDKSPAVSRPRGVSRTG